MEHFVPNHLAAHTTLCFNAAMEFYKHVLTDELALRQARSEAYSLRGFAKFLGLAPSTLSEILNNKRNLPKKNIIPVAKKLDLDPLREKAFIESAKGQRISLKNLSQTRAPHIEKTILDEQKDYNIIAKWEYYAVLNLTELDDFRPCPIWMAKRLNIKESLVLKILEELQERGLIQRDKEKDIKRTQTNLETTQDVFSQALRHSHLDNLNLAAQKLESVPLDKRFFSSTTMTIDGEKIDDAKNLIREFREKLSQLMACEKKNEVYQFNIQLFPLTHPSEEKAQHGVIQ